jgi:phosphoenolpyruvate carboxykinase (ATP)
MNYLMPKRDVLSMHCSATEGEDGDVSLFFGLSGTGKTTLSADANRQLIGDDEHCWTDSGVFNIEGGCYAKVIDISPEDEPEIFNSIRFGTVLENVCYDEHSREVDYTDKSVTANTRASYPVDIIPNAKIPAICGHPSNVIFLTCDAFGVLPPVSKLSPAQAMYHFINGYTAKIPGTEVGVQEPNATFSACYGAPFMVWHPFRYAELLAEKLRKHNVATWLINTGWTGGAFGKGQRFKLKYTRAMVDAVHSGALAKADTIEDPIFGLTIPLTCPEVPAEVLQPWQTWSSRDQYDATARKLAGLFQENFQQFADDVNEEVRAAAPRI